MIEGFMDNLRSKNQLFDLFSTFLFQKASALLLFLLFSHNQKFKKLIKYINQPAQEQTHMLSTLKLTTSTELGKQQIRKLKQIWQSIQDNQQSVQFRMPVNWQALGLIDYLTFITHPMDLNTVHQKLQAGGYGSVEEMLDDMQLIWDNCKLYNQKGSWIYALAEKLEKLFKKNVKNHFPMISLPGAPAKTSAVKPQTEQIKHDQKLKFVQRIKVLKPEQLGLVVDKIQELCPNAFKQGEDQRVQIIVNAIDLKSWKQILTTLQNVEDSEDLNSKRQKI